ncbi:hypothetical protein, partial [Methanosaeta sp. UBA356]|uniref:hypothetical protein n=1 Tax=Methanosaeta sp. UBA356 TaxID=1915559 RepID=UPI00257CBBE4
ISSTINYSVLIKYRAPRYLAWVDLKRKFSVSFRLCGKPLFFDPTTEAQRHRGTKAIFSA